MTTIVYLDLDEQLLPRQPGRPTCGGIGGADQGSAAESTPPIACVVADNKIKE
jgi:hypothetical protein